MGKQSDRKLGGSVENSEGRHLLTEEVKWPGSIILEDNSVRQLPPIPRPWVQPSPKQQ